LRKKNRGIDLGSSLTVSFSVEYTEPRGYRMEKKKTLKRPVILSGVGVHTGSRTRLRLVPSESGEIIFVRKDLGDQEFRLDPEKAEARNCTLLRSGTGCVLTVEHLAAVLWVYGIGSLQVELEGEEVPILDGSAAPFVRAVVRAGVREIPDSWKSIEVVEPFILREGEASISVFPDPEFKVTGHIHYDHPSIGRQGLSLVISPGTFEQEVAPARTFGFLEDVPRLRSRGLSRGGSLENAVVLDKKRIINGPLRFPDEFVRHKILDFLGDLAFVRARVRGHFIVKRGGHALHLRLVRFLLDHPEHTSISG